MYAGSIKYGYFGEYGENLARIRVHIASRRRPDPTSIAGARPSSVHMSLASSWFQGAPLAIFLFLSAWLRIFPSRCVLKNCCNLWDEVHVTRHGVSRSRSECAIVANHIELFQPISSRSGVCSYLFTFSKVSRFDTTESSWPSSAFYTTIYKFKSMMPTGEAV
ncbi:hypothetical protein CLIB1423_19S02256 [[Candida] railenensis]|uniref:Uncharacterized protein n=1 Tax=[Candida] railenensis TaxID=45579 RepID=A0A9P0W0Q9_9ASCO|nr:hypothetical protein CLIB1423_19S02256 [[Candida] railenensis]